MLSILTLTVLAIAIEVDTLNVPSNQSTINNGSENQHIWTSQNNGTPSSIQDKYKQFEQKYAQTLMNSSFLPFVDECKAVMVRPKPVAQQKVKFLCLTYFDMLNNLIVHAVEDFMLADNVNATLKEYDNATLVNNFCMLFGGELSTNNDPQPFVSGMLENSWINATKSPEKCKMLCNDLADPNTIQITPICKLISAGYRLIRQHPVDSKDAVNARGLIDAKVGSVTGASIQSNSKTLVKVTDDQSKASPIVVNETKAQPVSVHAESHVPQSDKVSE